MPTYEYICRDCGKRFDHFQSMSSPALVSYECCKNEPSSVERVISGGTGLIFKGSGFYLTDYKNSNKEKNGSYFFFSDYYYLNKKSRKTKYFVDDATNIHNEDDLIKACKNLKKEN